jgi:serine/threonine protein kinase
MERQAPGVRAIFDQAREIHSHGERTAFLDRACAGAPDIRGEVEALLRAGDEAGSFLETPAAGRLPGELAARLGADDTRTAPVADDGGGLDFLEPSDKPGSIGRLRHYEVQVLVGRGGMGIVLRAFDETLHRVVAIKVMAPQLATSATARRRFTREARAAAAVTHDHVVTIHAVEDAGPLPYIIMQFVAGQSLQDRLDRSGPLPVAEILRIGMQAGSGLAAAHAQGLVHRDVKPANILLENGVERVKLTDFGLARAADDASLTQSGTVAGTPAFMSPEQAEGKPVDHRSDLFSLGSVLYAMCTGRPPFRAGTSMGVLKRVCEDTPTPVREANPEVPDWLAAVVEKLHAKDPAARYQSGAEVAEVLGRHLARIQHPSVVPLPVVPNESSGREPAVSTTTLGSRPPARRRWAVAATALVAMLAILATTEATGVTNLRATVIRILTPDGTLVVETDDPAVKVTVEGDGDLVITGAGPQEVRLRAGSYRLKATRDGKPVKLDRDLVAISRGDRQIVKVRLEDEPPTAAVPKAEPGAFVLLGGRGVAERKFDTLAEAVMGCAEGDTIEVRGNGPFVLEPVRIHRALTIRAGEGFRPSVRIVPGTPGDDYLITTDAPLVLEGLDIREVSKRRTQPAVVSRSVIYCGGSSLRMAGCRVWQEEPVLEPANLILAFSDILLRNCEFRAMLGPTVGVGNNVPVRCVFDNCLGVGGGAAYLHYADAGNRALIEFHRSTFASFLHASVGFSVAPDPPGKVPGQKRVRFEASDNVFDMQAGMLQIELMGKFAEKEKWQKPADAEAVFMPQVGWAEERNVYSSGSAEVYWSPGRDQSRRIAPGGLKDWQRRWNLTDTSSFEGPIRFHGGDLRLKAAAAPEKLTPADFRLRPDSAGYRAGPGGKDLGADVDLVGPGPAYERWKKTPDYQQWLKDTGQVKK